MLLPEACEALDGQVRDLSTPLFLVPATELPAVPRLSPLVPCAFALASFNTGKDGQGLCRAGFLVFISKKPLLSLNPNRPRFLSASFLQWPHAGPSPNPFITPAQ